jgi:hypothetical protein
MSKGTNIMSVKKRKFSIPKRQTGYRSCKPFKNVFGLLMIKKLIHKDMITICKYIHPKNYSSTEAKEEIKQIKEGIIKKTYKIEPMMVVQIGGIFNITNPRHVKVILAIKCITYRLISTNELDKINVALLVYPYISKEELQKMCAISY